MTLYLIGCILIYAGNAATGYPGGAAVVAGIACLAGSFVNGVTGLIAKV